VRGSDSEKDSMGEVFESYDRLMDDIDVSFFRSVPVLVIKDSTQNQSVE